MSFALFFSMCNHFLQEKKNSIMYISNPGEIKPHTDHWWKTQRGEVNKLWQITPHDKVRCDVQICVCYLYDWRVCGGLSAAAITERLHPGTQQPRLHSDLTVFYIPCIPSVPRLAPCLPFTVHMYLWHLWEKQQLWYVGNNNHRAFLYGLNSGSDEDCAVMKCILSTAQVCFSPLRSSRTADCTLFKHSSALPASRSLCHICQM